MDSYLSLLLFSPLSNTFFDPSHDTKVIVHGYTQNGDVQWMYDMQEAFLNLEDVNVIRVDWRGGAVGLYGKAVANTRIVGAEISLVIDRIKVILVFLSIFSLFNILLLPYFIINFLKPFRQVCMVWFNKDFKSVYHYAQ